MITSPTTTTMRSPSRAFFALTAFAAGELFAADPAPLPATPPLPEIYADLVFADGFEILPFAAPPMMNSPICASASATGEVFITSDPNGNADTNKGVGKVYRLVDNDDDGRADTVTEFVSAVDSPRGIVAEGNTVYVLHPPHISAYTDTDGDGKSDEEKILVRNIGWDFSERRADHASNGLTMGIDGWLYAAIGDYGFVKAEGTDGRTLQLRGGGVVRVRRDGTGLDIYCRGTRNIVKVEMSPLLDAFARDNNNDGGGWNVRFHHFSGLEDHGYPSLYKNFADEAVPPIVDYGGGAGCGGVWVAEPGWPAAWNNQPIEAEWGRQIIYGHTLVPKGATFEETAAPAEFCSVKPGVKNPNAFRPNDLDIDARGRLFLVSWRNGGFGGGPKVGFLFRIQPNGHKPPALPDWKSLPPVDLARMHESPSHRLRLEAQRRLLVRGINDESRRILCEIAARGDATTESRVAAIFTLAQADREQAWPVLAELAKDPRVAAWAVRAIADEEQIAASAPLDTIKAALASSDPRVRREGVVAVARVGNRELASLVTPLFDDADPIVSHTAMRSVVRLAGVDACLAVFDDASASPAKRQRAAQAIERLHEKAAVSGLVERLDRETDSARRRPMLAVLCRLYHREGEWKRDSWGTVPDTRGPYYEFERWSESDRIAAALVEAAGRAAGDEAVWLSAEMGRNRVALPAATAAFLAAAETEPQLVAPLVRQLSLGEEIPEAAVPLLIRVARDKATDHDTRNYAIGALMKVDSGDAIAAIVNAYTQPCGGDGFWPTRFAFRESPYFVRHHRRIIEIAASKTNDSRFADEVLMIVANNVVAPQAVRDDCVKAIEEGFAEGGKRRQSLLSAARDLGAGADFIARLAAPLVSSDDENLKKLADHYFHVCHIDPKKTLAAGDKPPETLVGSLPVDKAIEAACEAKGNLTRGKQLFKMLACSACHTVKPDERPKGPYLGNTAAIYPRHQLAAAILEPSKTIAQGFQTNVLVLDNGRVLTGFVVREAADAVTLRLADTSELVIRKETIEDRKKLDGVSVMPTGLVANVTPEDFGSLLTYIESLVPKSPPGHGK